MKKYENNQVVLLLVGKNPSLKKQVINKLIDSYDLKDVYSVVDPLRVLLNKTLGLTLEMFNKEELKTKKMVPPLQMINSKLSKLVLTFREMLPKNHAFNPYTVGEGKYVLGPFETPKHAMLEIGNKFVNQIMPLFCSTLSYADIEGKSGLYLVTGIRKKDEIDLAKSLFQNVFTIKVPNVKNVDDKYDLYDTEKTYKLLETDFSIKNIDKLDEVMEKLDVKNTPIKNISRNASELLNKMDKPSAENMRGGKDGRFVFEPRHALPSHADTVVWLKPLSQKD